MSSTYNIEPPPTAKVLLQTSYGDIELEIFAKQTPLTSRNFLQHCIDGYYDGTIFHRVAPGFVLQGGDPTGTGDGGDSIYPNGPFADEFHSRLKFNRRGLLGMANSGRKNDNGSQFFITLGKTEDLTGKNTMFGRVVGDTIYNVVKMGEIELLDNSERPLYPTKITGVEVLLNPFEDMKKREIKPSQATIAHKAPEKKKAKKTGKVLLSFGDEGEDVGEPLAKKAKFNSKLLADTEIPSHPKPANRGRDEEEKPHRVRQKRSLTPPPRPLTPDESRTQLPLPDEEKPDRSPSSSPEPELIRKMSTVLDRTNAQIAELKASMKRTIHDVRNEPEPKRSALEEMIPQSAMRGRKRKQANRSNAEADDRALKMLDAFRAKLDKAPDQKTYLGHTNVDKDETTHNEDANKSRVEEEAELCDLHFIANCQSCKAWDEDGAAEEEEDPNDKTWMSHSLVFGKDRLGKDLSWKKQNEDDLVVIDPREKARDVHEEQQRDRRRERRSTRDWDRDRDKRASNDTGRDGYRDLRRDGDRDSRRDRDFEGGRDRRVHNGRHGEYDRHR